MDFKYEEPEYIEKIKKYRRTYYIKNKERISNYQKEYYRKKMIESKGYKYYWKGEKIKGGYKREYGEIILTFD